MATIRQAELPGAISQQQEPNNADIITNAGKMKATAVAQLGTIAAEGYGKKIVDDYASDAAELNDLLSQPDEPLPSDPTVVPEYTSDPELDMEAAPSPLVSNIPENARAALKGIVDRTVAMSRAIESGGVSATYGRIMMERQLRRAIANHPAYTDELVGAARNAFGVNPLGSQLAALEEARKAQQSTAQNMVEVARDWSVKNNYPAITTTEQEVKDMVTNYLYISGLEARTKQSNVRVESGLASLTEEAPYYRAVAFEEAHFEIKKLNARFFANDETYADLVKTGRLEEYQRALLETKAQFMTQAKALPWFKGQPEEAIKKFYPEVFGLFDSYANENSADYVAKMADRMTNAFNADLYIKDPSLLQIKALAQVIGGLPEGMTAGQVNDQREITELIMMKVKDILSVPTPNGKPRVTPVTDEELNKSSNVTPMADINYSDLQHGVATQYLIDSAVKAVADNPADQAARTALFRTVVAAADGLAHWQQYNPGKPVSPKALLSYLKAVGSPEWRDMYNNAPPTELEKLGQDAFNSINVALDTASYHVATTMMAPWGVGSTAEKDGFITISTGGFGNLVKAAFGTEDTKLRFIPGDFFIFDYDEAAANGKIVIEVDRPAIEQWVKENIPNGMWRGEEAVPKLISMAENRVLRLTSTVIPILEQAALTKTALLTDGEALTTPGRIITSLLEDLVGRNGG